MELRRSLRAFHIYAIATGAMISSGLFILPGLAHARAGPAVVLSYLLAGLLAIPGLLSIAELTTAMPKAGGDYFFIARGMGGGVGTVAALLTWFSLSLKSAFALVGMAAFVQLVAPLDPRLSGIVLAALFVAINVVGVREAAGLQVVLVAGLLILMGLYLALGLPAVNVRHFEPFSPGGFRAVFATAGFVFVSYGGLLKIASMAEEVREPGRAVPLALVLSLVTGLVSYPLMVFVTSGVLRAEELNLSLRPISDGARVFMGRGGELAMAVAAILAFVSTANAGIMAASRYLLAVSRDQLLPRPFGRVNRRFQTPHVAILVTGVVVTAALLVKVDALVKAASTVFILSYLLSNLSVIVLRESGVQNYRPSFRSPLYPWIQLLGIVGLAFILLEMGETAFLVSAALIVLGFLVYWFYGRSRSQQESAILHLVQRITAKELVTGALEAELKEIVRQRDEIQLDRFDHIIERSVVLDLDKSLSAEEFFRLAAEKMHGRLNISPEKLARQLLDRERETSTVLSPGLAIPHVVIEGEQAFDILLARCREGIIFSRGAAPVHTAFVLVGTRDERNFHLQALSAIAQIVQDRRFERRWMTVRGEQALRDLVLLAQRHRR